MHFAVALHAYLPGTRWLASLKALSACSFALLANSWTFLADARISWASYWDWGKHLGSSPCVLSRALLLPHLRFLQVLWHGSLSREQACLPCWQIYSSWLALLACTYESNMTHQERECFVHSCCSTAPAGVESKGVPSTTQVHTRRPKPITLSNVILPASRSYQFDACCCTLCYLHWAFRSYVGIYMCTQVQRAFAWHVTIQQPSS